MNETTEPVSETNNTSNVTNINRNPVGRPKGSTTKAKPSSADSNPSDIQTQVEEDKPARTYSAAEIERDLVTILEIPTLKESELRLINETYPLNTVPRWNRSFQAIRRDYSYDSEVIEIFDNNTARRVTRELIAADFAGFLGGLAGASALYCSGYPKAKVVVECWSHKTRPLLEKPIPIWGFKSDENLCFNRLNYDPVEVTHEQLKTCAPTFYAMLERMENADAFAARVGSMFYPKASRKQLMWNFGPSGGGKSQIPNIIEALLGNAVAFLQEKDFEDKYYLCDITEARAVVLIEPTPAFLTSKEFLVLTGDRKIRTRQIYSRAEPKELDCILFVITNDLPEFPNRQEIKNRIIPNECAAIPENEKLPEKVVKQLLEASADYIAGYCMRKYRELCPNHEAINFDVEKHLQPSIDKFEGDFLDIVETHFRIGEPYWLAREDLRKILERYKIKLRPTKKDQQEQDFEKFLFARFPSIKEKRQNRHFPKFDVPALRGFSGIGLKP